MNEITLVLRLEDPPSVSNKAVAHALEQGTALEVLLVIGSHLYHYGHNDVIVPGKGRAGFLAYVSGEIAEQGRKKAEGLYAEAAARGIPIRIEPVMEEDCRALITARLARGEGPVMAGKVKRTLFPIFKSDPVGAALKNSSRETITL